MVRGCSVIIMITDEVDRAKYGTGLVGAPSVSKGRS
jgi:hypothetical protein